MSKPTTHTAALDIARTDCIIFDCDGVLVDVSESYYATIDRTARHVLERIAQVRDPASVSRDMIESFKATGGFNDEVDLTYAAVLCAAAADRLGADPGKLVSDAAANSDGVPSVEQYISGIADVSDVVGALDYPRGGAANALRSTFNQIFYGPDLYQKIHSQESEFDAPGLIERDVLLVDDDVLDWLSRRYGRMALVTGRGLESARHSLGVMLGRFDLDHSFFLEDMPRNLAKPNPEPLLRSMRGMGCGRCMYVGDSMEDLMMAKSPQLEGTVAFCGICGTSGDPARKKEMFERSGADITLDSVQMLPKALNLD